MRFATRRAICRSAFVVFCVAPTMLFGGAAWFVQSPTYHTWYNARWEGALSAVMGAEVHVERAVCKQHNDTVLYGVRIKDPERQRPVVRVRSVEIARDGTRWDIELNQCAIERDAVVWLTQRLHEHVLVSGGWNARVQVHARNLILVGGDAPLCLADFNCRLQAGKAGRETLIDLKMPDAANGAPIRMRIVRNRQLDPPATGWELHTGPTPLPCSMASPWLPAVTCLGTDCAFVGSIWVELTGSGSNAQLAGKFLNADLDQLVTRSFPHKLSGMAMVRIEHVVLRSGRLIEANGTLEASGGVISTSLLRAAGIALHWQRRAADNGSMLMRYQKLGLKFTLNAKSLTVTGLAGAAGTVLTDNHGVLLSIDQPQAVSPLALVRLLAPDSQWTVPATKETALLVRVLPLPEIVPTDTSNARAPYATLRLRR